MCHVCMTSYPAGAAAGSCFLLVSSFFFFFFLYPAGAAAGYCFLLVTLPAQPKGTVSYSFLLYPAGAAAGYCILLVSSFLPCRRSRRVLYLTRFFFLLLLLLATLLRLISQSCLDRFQPDLVTRTPDPASTCHTTSLGSKVM